MKPNTYITAGILTYNPIYLTAILITLVAVSLACKTNWKKHLKTGLIFGTLPLLINTLFVHRGATVLMQIPAKTSILSFSIPIFLLSGPITLESITFGLTMALLLVDMVLTFGIFSSIVTPDALLRITPKFFFNSTLLTSIALRFTPVISDDMQAIRDAQRSRGLNLSQGNLFVRLMKHKALVVPAVVSSLERSLSLAEAMASRAFNKNRTKYIVERWHINDYLTIGMLAISLAILLYSKANGLLSYWPYNSLTPAFSLIPLAAILLLVTPTLK